jgi:acetyl-CoA acetyltransferase
MDKLYDTDRRASMRALFGAMDVRAMDWMSDSIEQESGAGSIFMEHYYARVAREYMAAAGVDAEDLAQVAVKNRKHASLNEFAQYRTPLTIGDVLKSPIVAQPLTTLMCSPLTDGAVAFLVCSADMVRKAALVPVEIAASVVTSGFPQQNEAEPVIRRAAGRAYEQAGIGPEDIDFAEVHEASAVAELICLDQIGLVAPGEGVSLLRAGQTALGGRLPVNPSGGLLSRGHPGAATGAAQIAELVWQLQRSAGERQVDGARVGLAQSSGGLVGDEAAATAITILRR